jgi:hypothetical protein
MTEPGGPSSEDATPSPEEGLDASAADRPSEGALDSETSSQENAAQLVPPLGRRSRPRRLPALIVAAVLVGAGVFLALRGMQQVVARAPATPVPITINSPTPTSNQAPPSPTPQPTPMPTSSPLILEP